MVIFNSVGINFDQDIVIVFVCSSCFSLPLESDNMVSLNQKMLVV